jgi:hypothetical protein
MSSGLKGFPRYPYTSSPGSKRMRGYPANQFSYGMFGYPQRDKLVNAYKVDAFGKTQLRAFGDSITSGLNADAGKSYLDFLNTNLGTSLINYAVGGRGAWNQAGAAQSASWTAGQVLILGNFGKNDLKRAINAANGSEVNPKTLNKIWCGYTGLMLKGLITGQAASGSASVTRTGSFTAYPANTVGGTFQALSIPGSTTATFCNGAGNVWSWNFTGTAFAVQVFGVDGVTYTHGNCTIAVDGTPIYEFVGNGWYDAISDGANDNGRGPVPLVFFGLPSGAHTVTVTSSTAGFTAVDYFCGIIPPESGSAPSALFCEIPYETSQGYTGATLTGSTVVVNSTLAYGSKRSFDTASKMILGIVKRFRAQGYNVGYAYTNKFLSPNNIPDYTHPNNRGHAQMYYAAVNAIKRPYLSIAMP